MGVFDEYRTREELLGAIESAISRRDDGEGGATWRIVDDERDALQRRYESAARGLENARRRGEELEARLAKADQERAEVVAELERARNEERAPNDLHATLKRYERQATTAQSKLAALEAQLAPLREENARYKAREERRVIESQLVDAARKLDCRESAMRDVKRLAPLFRLNEDGLAVTEDSKLVAETLREEIALSPHWLNPSQGGAAHPGNERDAYSSRERFQDALQRGDFGDVIRYAPRADARFRP